MMDINARPSRRLRCAIYTRKSSEEGLDMEFNSLDAQREVCEAYIASRKSEGWVATRDRYDDGRLPAERRPDAESTSPACHRPGLGLAAGDEAGGFATIQELAETAGLAVRHVSRQLRLAWLAPDVLKRLTCGREASAVNLYDWCFLAGEA